MNRHNEFSFIDVNETTRTREIMDLIKEFDPVNVLHMDKIGWFYHMKSYRSLATHH